MHLQNINLGDMLPLFMRADADTRAMAAGLSEVLQVLAGQIAKLSTWDHLDSLTTGELDALADELRVFWYKSDLSDEQKRAILLDSDKVYMHLGTVSAVQSVITDVFGTAKVEEWYEYGGRPHYFRINVSTSETMTRENEAKLIALIDKVKRKSQWLEKIVNEIRASMQLHVGVTLAVSRRTRITISQWQDNTPATSYRAGTTTVTRYAESQEVTQG